MDTLVRLIQKIGIFMIAAQAVIHFAPGVKYEKYIKLIVGIMILLQFLSPIYGVMETAEKEWKEQLFLIEQRLETDGWDDAKGSGMEAYGSVSQTVTDRLEEEIKSRLNEEIAEENYYVSSVIVVMQETGVRDETGTAQYELGRVRVMVHTLTEQGKAEISIPPEVDPVETVRIDKIDKINVEIDAVQVEKEAKEEGKEASEKEKEEKETSKGEGEETGEGGEREFEDADRLRECFCKSLGIEKERVEVTIYGAG